VSIHVVSIQLSTACFTLWQLLEIPSNLKGCIFLAAKRGRSISTVRMAVSIGNESTSEGSFVLVDCACLFPRPDQRK